MALPTITTAPTAPSRSDTPTTFNTLADAFVAWQATFPTQINAWAAELPAVVSGIDYNGTSTSNIAVGTGSKTFTTQTGKNFYVGQAVRVSNTATPANYMDGQVTSYSGSTLIVNVTAIGGTGTFAAWTIGMAVAAGSYVTLTGAETLTNKVLTTPTLSGASGSTAARIGYASGVLSFGDGSVQQSVATLVSAQTLTNKTVALGSNTVSGTTAQFNTALTDGDFATLAGTETFTNKTLTSPVISGGTINSTATVLDTGTIAANSVGFRGVPVSANVTGTLVLADAGEQLIVTTNQIIPANASVAFPIGTLIEIYNNSAAAITVAITTDTLRLAGGATTGTRTIAAYGSCFLSKKTATVWSASGNVT